MIAIATSKEGMGCRLKCLLSVMRLYGKYKIYWFRNQNANCNWHDLFENNIEIESTERKHHHFVRWLRQNPKYAVYFSYRFDPTEDEKKRYGTKRFDFMYKGTPKGIRNGILNQVKTLIPIEGCRNEIEAFKKQFNKHTISVCVRTWKDVYGTDKARRFDLNEVFEYVDEHLATNMFITSDEKELYKQFKARYGKDRVLHYPSHSDNTVDDMRETLIELYLGGVNRKMLLTWHSNYTDAQWWFGGGHAEVIEMCRWQ